MQRTPRAATAAALLLLWVAPPAFADEAEPGFVGASDAPAASRFGYGNRRPDGHAPIGVMGDHLHKTGDLMLSYRFMHMQMNQNYVGDQTVSGSEVLQSFPVTPTSMWMQMHMFGAMLGVTDWVTGSLMVPYLSKAMDHETRMGREFRTRSHGLGDVKAQALVRILQKDHHELHGSLGLSFPTGSIDQKDTTPMGWVQLPYPMQLGSGTWDVLLGATYNGQAELVSWGAQASGLVRSGENGHDYRLGNAYDVTAWFAFPWTDWVSTGLRADFQQWFNIVGADPALNPAVVPTADPDLRGGLRLDGLLSLNVRVPRGRLQGLRIGIEGGLPLYQNLDGPQLGVSWLLTGGIQYAFHGLF